MTNKFLPLSPEEVKRNGWTEVDVVLVTADAYVDAPSFANAVIGRALENCGFKVAVLSRPDWRDINVFKIFGRPKLFFAVSAGNVDSMLNLYTANRKPRSEDDYAEGGIAGGRPERASIVYCNAIRQAYPGIGIALGGIEASTRRLAHYDYWSDTVKRSILLDAKADILVYGMGEKTICEIAKRVSAGENIKNITDVRSTIISPGAKYKPPQGNIETIPSYDEVKTDKEKFLLATRIFFENLNPYTAKILIQYHGDRAVIQNPPALPLSQDEMDGIYNLPFQRKPHPSYKKPIPAFEMIKHSITSHRGCFGGCSFCSLSMHQGKIIQSRSQSSIINEAQKITRDKDFTGYISDVGGPSANMYGAQCANAEKCARQSCLWPDICQNLKCGAAVLRGVLKKLRELPSIKKVLINSGIRMDLALKTPEYIKDLAHHHTGGQLSVAPEHICPHILDIMRKPKNEAFEKFAREFFKHSAAAGKEQFLTPYFISGFPGSTVKDMVETALFLKKHKMRPRQVNDFIPLPMQLATAIYYAGKDPFTGKEIRTAKTETERKYQRAVLQWFIPKNKKMVLSALKSAGLLRRTPYLFGK